MQSEWGHALHVTVFGASHTPELGVKIERLPKGLPVDVDALQAFLNRRAPGTAVGATARREPDRVMIRSGLSDGVTTGEPLIAAIENVNADSAPYQAFRDIPRPSHVDYPARLRFGEGVDLAGSGHFSGRMTAAYCIAGGIAMQQLARTGVTIGAHLLSVGGVEDTPFDPVHPDPDALRAIGTRPFPVLDEAAGMRMQERVLNVQSSGDSVGGVIECVVCGFPEGHGTPLFSGIDSRLAELLFAVPAVRGVAFGSGFDAARMTGSEHNDPFCLRNGAVRTETNRHGGLIGGISTGMPILFTVSVKPASGIAKAQTTLNLRTGRQESFIIRGRHDACIAVRAVPVIEAVAALALYDVLLEEAYAE